MTVKKIMLMLVVALILAAAAIVPNLNMGHYLTLLQLLFFILIAMLPLIHGLRACPKRLPNIWVTILLIFGWLAYPFFLWKLTASPYEKKNQVLGDQSKKASKSVNVSSSEVDSINGQ